MIKGRKSWITAFIVSTIFVFSFQSAGCGGGGGSESSLPIPPTNLQTTAVSSSQVELSWTDNSDNEEGFKIERMVSGGSYALVTALAANTTSYSDTGLTSATLYSYRIKASNSAGDSDYSNEATATTLNDATIPAGTTPDTSITSHPQNPSNQVSMTFEFASTEAGSTFECQLDSKGWNTCSSPQVYYPGTNYSDGGHTFEVRAMNPTRTAIDQTPASYTWTIDTTSPVQSGWSPSWGSIATKSPTITLSLNENGDCKWSLSAQSYAGMAGDCIGDGTTSISCGVSGLSEGANTVYLSCRDSLGNADTAATSTGRAYTVDTAPPVQNYLSPASGATITTKSPTVTVGLNENGDCKWSLSDEDYASMADDCTGDGTISILCGVSGLLEGANTVYIACRDSVLNADTAATNTHLTYTVDTTLPVQSGWSPASASAIATKSPTINFSLSEMGACQWFLSDQGYDLNVANTCSCNQSFSCSCGVSGLSEGANTVYIACKDMPGNADTAATNKLLTYTVDTTPPTQSGWSPVTGKTPFPTITLGLNESGDCKWSLSDQNYADMSGDCTGDGTNSISCGVSGISASDGAKTIYIACRDSLLNADTAATNKHLTYTLDTTPPVQSGWSPASASLIKTNSPTITLSLNENGDCKWSITDLSYSGMSGDCTGDGTASISCATSGLPEGAASVHIACQDSLGNGDTAGTNKDLNYTVDTAPPDTSITGNPSDPSPQASATFAFNSLPEIGLSFECQIDSGGYSACTSPKIYLGLYEGSHTFDVRAIDLAGNKDPTPAHYEWIITDINPPTFSGIKDILALSDTGVMLFWAPATDDIMPQSAITYEICQSTAAGACAAGFTATYTVGPNIWNYKVTGLTAGQTYYYVIRAKDNSAANNENTNTIEKKREYLAAIQISAGHHHTCALLADKTVKCWGANEYGQLGNGTSTNSNIPVYASGITTAAYISAGGFHTCARLTDNKIKCWGANGYGQLGDGTNSNSNTPVAVSGITTAAEISAGGNHTCARLTDNSVRCWGSNWKGQLGDGTNTNSNIPVAVSGITTAAEISTGGYHTCARLVDNTTHCWGYNYQGQLGDGTNSDSNVPVTVSGISNFAVEINAGYLHNCARLADNSLRCWGYNNDGELGNGTNANSNIPVTVSGGINTAAEINAGYYHTCARLADNSLRCWGYNNDGELGDGTNWNSNTPVTVSGITTAAEITTGMYHTCARLADNTIRCWGHNNEGELGDGTNNTYNIPVAASGITAAAEISAGKTHACARLTNHTVICWGYNNEGELGDGTNSNSNTPVTVSGITTAAEISAGYYHTCAKLTDNTIRCWGGNWSGQLGDGTYNTSNTQVTVSGITTAAEISAGGNFTCARLADNTVKCWGRNNEGELGDGTYNTSNTPVTVSGITTAAEINAGNGHTCARLTGNTIKCWGYNNDGELGDGTYDNSNTPVTVSGITTAAEVSAGGNHTCARLTDNSIRCWGANWSGELGDATYDTSNTPVAVSGGITAAEISAGGNHTCARLADNSIRCWGYNGYGELGDGTWTDSNTPVTVSGITTAAEITTGEEHTCARLADNSIRCWGDNENGQFGAGYFGNINTPVQVINP
ncbi:MAG: fibronectin type III domain-containing protein [bacterium]|nr:fibronectin type III domain-containing protein [bacterium]